MTLSLHLFNIFSKLFRHFFDTIWTLPLHLLDNSLALPWNFLDIFLTLHLHCLNTSSRLPTFSMIFKNCFDTSMTHSGHFWDYNDTWQILYTSLKLSQNFCQVQPQHKAPAGFSWLHTHLIQPTRAKKCPTYCKIVAKFHFFMLDKFFWYLTFKYKMHHTTSPD